jgi:hypothetical protein
MEDNILTTHLDIQCLTVPVFDCTLICHMCWITVNDCCNGQGGEGERGEGNGVTMNEGAEGGPGPPSGE